MKKPCLLLILLTAAAVFGFAGAEEIDVYAYLYNASPSISAQLGILQNMVEAKLTGAGDFYAKALNRLVSEYKNIKNAAERSAAEEQARILATLLGAEKYTQAADDLWLVVESFTDPLTKAEALVTLGRIRAATYLPQIVRVLNTINAAPTSDRLYGERIAFGAIISLEKYQDSSGYFPVFTASTGWYSDRIKNQAKRSLQFIKNPGG
jgi:cation transport regulator ChaB